MKTVGIAFATTMLVSLTVSVPALAQTTRLRGTIEQIDNGLMTVKTREGGTVKLKLADDGRVVAIVKASLLDIKPDSFVGSTAMPQDNGRWRAVEVHIFPESLRGSGEGDRPFDYKPKSTMTNGAVKAIGKTTTGGTVSKEDDTSLTLHFKDGEKTVDVTPETVIVTYADANRDELKIGARIFAAVTRQSDGTLMASRINVGRGVAPPM